MNTSGTMTGWHDLGIVARMSKRKMKLFVRVLAVGTILVVVIALAGDDELRASLASWAGSPDRPWR